jgi:hypothetical protein
MLKTVSSITNAIGALNYKGTWNASTNTPTLADGTGAKGDYYVVSTAGTQTFDGILLFFGAGDWIVYNGAVWQRVEGGSDGNFSNVTLNSTDAGATAGPLLDLYRNSATPAASDTIGEIEFNGQDSAGNKQQYALIHGSILSPTSTTEQGQIHFETATAGASTEKMIIGTTNLVINEIGAVFNVRIEGDTDANLFYTDATNDRIGVGTISPSVKFEVNGAVSGSSFIPSSSSVPTNGVYLPAANSVGIATNSTNAVTVDSSGAVFANQKTVNVSNSVSTVSEVATLNLRTFNSNFGISNSLAIRSTLNNTTTGQSTASFAMFNQNAGSVDDIITITSGNASEIAFPRYGAGAATFSASGVISSVSDENYKIKDGKIADPIPMLMALETGYYYFRDMEIETPTPMQGNERQLGFYAQNVHSAIGKEAAPTPQTYIQTDLNGNKVTKTKPWGYYDRSVLAVAIEALKKQQIAIQAQSATIAALTVRIEALENK